MSTRRAALLCMFAVFGLVNAGNALHKGGDFDVFLESGARVMDRRPLYEGSSPGSGVIGPPFQAVFFVPSATLAAHSLAAARLSWYLANLAALIAGMWFWAEAVTAQSRAVASRTGSRAMLIAVAGIVLPTQTNFEHQNMNAVLLCLVGAAAWTAGRGRRGIAGLLIGAATALKAFPLLVVAYLMVKRESRIARSALVTAVALTALILVPYGAGGGWNTWTEWLAINREGGWPERLQNQSLYAMAARVAPSASPWLFAGLSAALLFSLLVLASRRRLTSRSAAAPHLARDLALALGVAVLLSPIAWDHYLLLLFPLFLVVGRRPQRSATWVTVVAAFLISGLSPVVFGAKGFDLARFWSTGTVGALLLVSAEIGLQLSGNRLAGNALEPPAETPKLG
ncbi:MAG: glycosyltransferase 87 family protein [Vicinamibacterales bacterium]